MAAKRRKSKSAFVPIKQHKRDKKVIILLSDEELELVDAYVKKRTTGSRSAFLRKLVMVKVLEKTADLSPSFFDLFDEIDKNGS